MSVRAQADTSQLVVLTALWLSLLLAGAGAATAALVAHRPTTLLGLAAAWAPQQHQQPPQPLLLLGGAALVAVASRALARLQSTTVVALKGDCPACGEECYAFVTCAHDNSTGGRVPHACHAQDCHVCGRPLRFEVRILEGGRGQPWPWQRRAAGRITLVAESRDFFPPSQMDGATGQ